MMLQLPTDLPPVLTVPRTAAVLRLTVAELVSLLDDHPELAERVVIAGGRRHLLASDLPAFVAALAAREAPSAGTKEQTIT
jgi:hypothetical protein